MKEALDQIIDYIDFAKKFDNFHDYYMARQFRNIKARKDYDDFIVTDKERYAELVTMYEKRYERIVKDEYFGRIYLRHWKNARENNIALVMGLSVFTLRALEALGYIKISKDDKDLIDEVKLVKRYEN